MFWSQIRQRHSLLLTLWLSYSQAARDTGAQFHQLINPLPSRALRVTATLGIASAIRAGAATATATEVGADPLAIGKLLRYLATIGILEQAGHQYALTPMGAHLDDEETTDELSSTHPTGRLALTFDGLPQATSTGQSVATHRSGGTNAE